MENDVNTGNMARMMKRGGLLLIAASIALAGCQGVLLSYKGAKVRSADLIALTEGTQRSAVYRSPDLTVEYQWERSVNELRLSGTMEFAPRIRNNFGTISSFLLSVFLTDEKGNILEERAIPTPGSSDSGNRFRFREKLLLPPGTANMAFTYSGEAYSGGIDDGNESISFWHVPIER